MNVKINNAHLILKVDAHHDKIMISMIDIYIYIFTILFMLMLFLMEAVKGREKKTTKYSFSSHVYEICTQAIYSKRSISYMGNI